MSDGRIDTARASNVTRRAERSTRPLLLVIVNDSGVVEEIQVSLPGSRLITLTTESRLSDKDLTEIINALNSGAKSAAFKIISEQRSFVESELVIETELFHKVGNKRDSRFAFPSIATKAERSEKLHDGASSKLRVGGIGVMFTQGLPNRASISGLPVGTDKSFTLISKKGAHKHGEHVFLFSLEDSQFFTGVWRIGVIKNILDILGTGSGNELKMPGSPEAWIRKRLEKGLIKTDGFTESFKRSIGLSDTRGRRGQACRTITVVEVHIISTQAIFGELSGSDVKPVRGTDRTLLSFLKVLTVTLRHKECNLMTTWQWKADRRVFDIIAVGQSADITT
jgi:hypothetical protein